MNEHVMDFIKLIDRLLQNCDLYVKFTFSSVYGRNTKDATSIHALLELLANKTFKFNLTNYGLSKRAFLNDFNRLFPGILNQLQFIRFSASLNPEDIDILLNWLTNQQSNDGKQKIIQFPGDPQRCVVLINRIKEVN